MLQRIFFVFLILIIQIYNAKSSEAFYPEASFFANETGFFLHTVERGETVYSIAAMYRISLDDIYALNPESKDGIKTGNTLKIPQETGSFLYHTIQAQETLYSVSRLYQMKGEDIISVNQGLSTETFTIGKVIRIPTNKVTSPLEGDNESSNRLKTNALLNQEFAVKEIEKIKVALLLPFGINENSSSGNAVKDRMIEYYEGFLLALEELKKKNISVHLQVYDTGPETDRIKSILEKKEMQDVHLLIGGLWNDQIHLLSVFASNNGIPYIIPFTSKSDEPLNNYNVYQVNTPQSYLYSKTSLAFYHKFRESNILFFDSGKGEDRDSGKADLITIIKADLTAKKIPHKTLFAETGLSFALEREIRPEMNNVFIPLDDSMASLIQLIETAKAIKESHPEISISLFGHPAWQKYAAELSSDFFYLNAHIYTIYYANPSSPEVKSFYNRYYRWYSRNLINIYPKYGMLGYDTGLFFIQLLSNFGTSYDVNVNKLKYNGIQTDFYFERVNNWSGFINMNLYFVEFNTNSRINIKRID
jgi:LysM repeat protein